TNRRRPLEWILTDVDHRRHVRRNFRTRPALRLQIELVLEVIDADCAKMRTAKVEELVAGGRRLALQQAQLVVAVEMVLVGSITQLHAFEQLVGNVWIAGRSEERREPI